MDFKRMIAGEIASALDIAFGNAPLNADEIAGLLELPPDSAMGDYAFPCFKLARSLRKAPPMIAAELVKVIDARFLSRVEAVGGYLNFFIDKALYASSVVEAVLGADGRYGATTEGEGKTICIDYSSINIAKRFSIGHLSTTAIGNSLYKIYNYLGYKCVGINHLGDWGTQFGKMIAAYKHWGSREMVEQGGVQALSDLYVRFHAEAEKDDSLNDEGRAWFKKIEQGDEEAISIWQWFKELTLKDVQRVYDMLGVKFDSYAGESFYIDKMQPVIDELRAKGLLKESDGAYLVDLSEYNMPPCLILRSDGASLYHTRDLAAAFYRKATYDFTKCLYVVAYQQDLHFKQLFKVIELMGYDWAKDLEHVAFGMISFEGQALSTRHGRILYLEDLLDRSIEKARKIIDEKSPQLENKDEVARKVGIGAVVFFALSASRIKDIDFWWDRALNFDGETGPYVQYTYARCCSVLGKAHVDAQPDYAGLSDPEAQDVVRLLERFPELVHEAAQRYEPSLITRYTVDLAQAYNKFYYEHRILDCEPGVSAARLALTKATRDVIGVGLKLIGVEPTEKM
ncbi:MAG TPA: arginine--tRNA ligase [Candidatus Fimadaptatus faecigallinarum]|uniref:Arginine--tRNA ligase n=1 Tax=Candidatus Fimadaptatus faecigallinarum TaxID=2840814 RepID=A0A9D1LQI0_9FIRM|nr:arginine--tRNA ligase [Candidatus Fimadaptatus faecigallinarum]